MSRSHYSVHKAKKLSELIKQETKLLKMNHLHPNKENDKKLKAIRKECMAILDYRIKKNS